MLQCLTHDSVIWYHLHGFMYLSPTYISNLFSSYSPFCSLYSSQFSSNESHLVFPLSVLFPLAISCACAAGQMPGQGPTWTLQPRAQCLPGLLARPVKALCASMTILVHGFSQPLFLIPHPHSPVMLILRSSKSSRWLLSTLSICFQNGVRDSDCYDSYHQISLSSILLKSCFLMCTKCLCLRKPAGIGGCFEMAAPGKGGAEKSVRSIPRKDS